MLTLVRQLNYRNEPYQRRRGMSSLLPLLPLLPFTPQNFEDDKKGLLECGLVDIVPLPRLVRETARNFYTQLPTCATLVSELTVPLQVILEPPA